MHAHTGAIRAFGARHSAIGDDVDVVAAQLASFPIGTDQDVFGPVGARFLRALAGANDHLVTTVRTLATSASAAASASVAAAGGYEAAEHIATEHISGLGT